MINDYYKYLHNVESLRIGKVEYNEYSFISSGGIFTSFLENGKVGSKITNIHLDMLKSSIYS